MRFGRILNEILIKKRRKKKERDIDSMYIAARVIVDATNISRPTNSPLFTTSPNINT